MRDPCLIRSSSEAAESLRDDGEPRTRRGSPCFWPSLLRDPLDDLAGLAVVAVARDVGLGENAHEPAVLLDDRQAPYLVLRHQPERLVEALGRVDRDQLRRGDLRTVVDSGSRPSATTRIAMSRRSASRQVGHRRRSARGRRPRPASSSRRATPASRRHRARVVRHQLADLVLLSHISPPQSA